MPRDPDADAGLIKAGATQYDIEKAGSIDEVEGYYYFFAQDPIYLQAPQIDGYRFQGFFDKATSKKATDTTSINPDGTINRWNMDNKNVELEARYIPFEYDIQLHVGYRDDAVMYTIHYDALNDEITSTSELPEFLKNYAGGYMLPSPGDYDGYLFQDWLKPDESTEPATLKEFWTLPRTEKELKHSTLDVYTHYEPKDCYVSFAFKDDQWNVIDTLTVQDCIYDYKARYESSHIQIDVAESYKYKETVVEFKINFAKIEEKGYEFIGIFVGDEKIGDSNTLINYLIVDNVEFIIKVQVKSQ